jgi:hypothetical protein
LRVSRTAISSLSILLRKRMRDLLERLQDHLQRRDLLRVGLGDDNGEVDGGDNALGLEGEFDRAGAVEEGQPVPHELGLGDVDLDAHLMGAPLGRGVADRVALGDGAERKSRSARLPERRYPARECPATVRPCLYWIAGGSRAAAAILR